jgi:hypothetical protein
MGRNAAAIGLLVALGLGACSNKNKLNEVDPNLFPTGYKQEILISMQRVLEDPTNVRDAFISEPALAPVGQEQRYAVCVRYNARNLAKVYQGSKDRIAFFYGGHLNQLVDAKPEQCARAAYQPFPELEKLCQAKKCA